MVAPSAVKEGTVVPFGRAQNVQASLWLPDLIRSTPIFVYCF